ncbi:MAG TPA: hypothetical protein VGG45_08145, partial [Terracidiphilus sp.]
MNNNRAAARTLRASRKGLRFCGPLLTLLLLLASTGRAAALDPSVMELFPKNVTEIGYADLDEARSLPWFPQFAAQVVPVSLYGFDQFLSAAQMQSTSSIDQVVWARFSPLDEDSATGSAAILLAGVATGKFQVDAIKSFLKLQRVPAVQLDDTIAYSAENGIGPGAVFFTFLDQNTIAFGSIDALKKLLNVRDGNEDSLSENEAMIDDIGRVNGGIFWGVLGSEDAQQAVERLMPVLRAFPQSRDLAGQIRQVAIGANDAGTIELNFQATTASAKDSILF